MTARELPECPLCGGPTAHHCRFCDWWRCAACSIHGIIGRTNHQPDIGARP